MGQYDAAMTGPRNSPAGEPPVVPGAVYGYRWWRLPAPDFRLSPAHAGWHWPHCPLHGARGPWGPGVSHAECLNPRTRHAPPARGCYCGFWANWDGLADSPLGDGPGVLPVFGAVKGFGAVRKGPKQFRAARMRILALHAAFTLQPVREVPGDPWRAAGFTGRVHYDDAWQSQRAPPAEDQEAQAHADAWMAVIGDRLGQDYGVPVFETRDALRARFPADPVYGPAARQACPRCGEPGPHHVTYCPPRVA
jgi:hypothetical protein